MSTYVPEDRRAAVIRLWKLNDTGGEIGRKLGLSRGQVMGILHRAKAQGLVEYKVGPSKPRVVSGAVPDTAPTKEPELSTGAEFVLPSYKQKPPRKPSSTPKPGKGVGLMKLTLDTCRYRLDKNGPDGLASFCGAKTHKHSSWCANHYKIVFQPLNPQRRITR